MGPILPPPKAYRKNAFNLVALIILQCAYAAPVKAQPNTQAIPQTSATQVASIDWRSSNQNLSSLYLSLENYYLHLANLGLLAVEKKTVEKNVALPSLFFRKEIPYLYWTSKIDNLLCDMNSDVCDRPRTQVGTSRLDKIDNVRGMNLTPPDKSHWHIARGDTIYIPQASIRATYRWASFKLGDNPNETIKNIYYRDALGCGAFGKDLGSNFLLGQDLSTLTAKLNDLQPSDCPRRITLQNAYWLLSASMHNSVGDGAPAAENQIAEILKQSNSGAESDTQSNWQSLQKIVDKSLAPTSKLAREIELPVISLRSSELVMGSGFNKAYGLYGKKWASAIKRLSFAARLAQLDKSRYSVSLLAASPKEANDAKKHLLENLNSNSAIRSLHGIGVKSYAPSISGWTSDVATSRAFKPGEENSKIYSFVDFSPTALNDPPQFASQILFLEKHGVDINSCFFSNNRPCSDPNADVLLTTQASNFPNGGDTAVTRLNAVLKDANHDEKFHGTAVAAIAAARPQSGLMTGIDPTAYVLSGKVDIAGNWLQENWSALRSETGLIPGPLTWNISAETAIRQNVLGIERSIEGQLNDGPKKYMRDIFVVSAGEVKNSMLAGMTAADCTIYPACLTRDAPLGASIVTVVGVMKDKSGVVRRFSEGDAPGDEGSFYHSSFQIAAPAKGFVVPSIDPDFFLRVDGVSFAVPLVSGTLAALRSHAGFSSTYAIARLMGCAVQYDSIKKYVVAGVLDVGCTLNIWHDQVSFEKDINGKALPRYSKLRSGRVLGVWYSDFSKRTNTLPFNDGVNVRGPFRIRPTTGFDSIVGIRRLGDKIGEVKVVALQKGKDEPDVDVRLPLDSGLIVEFLPEGSTKPVCFPISELRDYIPAPEVVSDKWPDTGAPTCPRQ